jgi:CTP:phosphocholine cytidylyltransferase-like protein
MSWSCRWLGLHSWEDLTPEHGFDIRVGGLDDEFDPSQFLFAKRCKKCGKLLTFVSDNYWTKHEASYWREATDEEIRKFLMHIEAQQRKTAVTGRLPTTP